MDSWDMDEPDLPQDELYDLVRKSKVALCEKLLLDAAKLPSSPININEPNIRGKTALYLAITSKNRDMINLLLDHGGNLNKESYCHETSSYETPIITAARIQRLDLLELLCEKGRDTISWASNTTRGPMHWAALHGNIPMAEFILQKDASLINCVDYRQNTPLHVAMLNRNSDMVRWLLAKGASPRLVNADCRSALHFAAVKGMHCCVKDLIEHNVDVARKDDFGFTSFGLACLGGHMKVISSLIEYAPSMVQFDRNDGLHRAAENGDLTLIKFLVHQGAQVNSRNSDNETALSIASRSQDKCVEYFLSIGAELDNVDSRGYTSLQTSLLRQRRDIAITLIRHGAYLHRKSNHTDSPLLLAHRIGDPLLLYFMLKAGCKLSEEKWFDQDLVTLKIKELDYNGQRRLPAYQNRRSRLFTSDLWTTLIDEMNKTPSLRQICRVAIRNIMSDARGHQSILKHIDSLPLPTALVQYLTLTDIIPCENEAKGD